MQRCVVDSVQRALLYHLFMWFADAPLRLSGFVDLLRRQSSHRRVILVIRASPCELPAGIIVALKNAGFASGPVRCPVAVHGDVREGVLSLRRAFTVLLLTGKRILLIHACAEVRLASLLAGEFLWGSERLF